MSDGCSKSHLELVRLVRFRLISDQFLYMIGKRLEFLIDMMERRDSTLRGYGEFHLFMTYFGVVSFNSRHKHVWRKQGLHDTL